MPVHEAAGESIRDYNERLWWERIIAQIDGGCPGRRLRRPRPEPQATDALQGLTRCRVRTSAEHDPNGMRQAVVYERNGDPRAG
jgi:hypothetical protein